MIKQKKKNRKEEKSGGSGIKDFIDMIAPSVLKFEIDHYVCGSSFRSVWALREYPTMTDEQALLRHLGEKDGVTLRIYTRKVTASEEKKILQNAANKNRLERSNPNDLRQTVTAENNLSDVITMISGMHRNREPLFHCAVYIELIAASLDELKMLQTEVQTELARGKLNVDKLLLAQKEGFLAVSPAGYNVFGSQFERVIPASSAANLYPFNYSGKTDKDGFYLGKDKFGSNVIVDFDKRDDDKTNSNVLILGNSGQGKSYLLKLIICNILCAGKKVIVLDPEHEYAELAQNLSGYFVDLVSGEYVINPLEPKTWREDETSQEECDINAFCEGGKISRHISFLKDFFRTYKHFEDRHIDTLELMLCRMYDELGITDKADLSNYSSKDYPILSDLYNYIEREYESEKDDKNLYDKETLRDILLALHSMCKGSDSMFFNGHTNILSDRFVVFGVKGLLQASNNLRDALLFNVLSFMSDKLLTEGHTAAVIDELYLFLSNLTAIEYIRNFTKRVRKKESAVLLASQNLEDFNIEGIREYTKPLFSIPTHTFLFNAGNIDKTFFIDNLQLLPSEYELIRYPQRGICLYKCGIERYNLVVHAPKYKEKLFGKAGGR